MTDIRELWIDGFGCLRAPRAAFRFERERITLYLDENEAGKSTLQMALVASLYGIETDRRKSCRGLIRAYHDHWFPLTGGAFGTRLRLHDGQRLLEIRWNFAEGGGLHVIDLETNHEVTEELCPGGDGRDLGRRLLGLSVEEFAKTCLVRQDDLARVQQAAGLEGLVQRAADSTAGDSTVALAQEKLNALLRNYPGVMLKGGGLVENEIRRLEDEAKEHRAKLTALEADRAAIAAEDAEFQSLAAQRDALRREVARLEYVVQLAEHDELTERVKKAEECRAELARLEAEREKLASLEGFPADQADHLTQWQAERRELLRQADEAERGMAELQRAGLEPARRDLASLGGLASVAQEEIESVSELLGKTRDFEAREQKLLDAISGEEDHLVSEGASIEELDRLEERFGGIEPGDGEFLTDQERAAAQGASEIEEAKRRVLEATLRADKVLETRQRQREEARRTLMTGLTIGAAGLVIGALLLLVPFPAHVPVGILLILAGAVVGLAFASKGHRAFAAAETFQAEELAEAQRQRVEIETRRERLAAEQRDRSTRLKGLARRFGYEQPEVLVEDYRSLDDLRRLCGTLIHLRSQMTELTRQREDLEEEVSARFQTHGEERRGGLALSEALGKLQERMARAVRLRERIGELERKLADEAGRRDGRRQRAEELTARIRAVFEKARLGDAKSVEEGLDAFKQDLRRYQRLRELTDVLIPQVRPTVLATPLIETWRTNAERLHRSIATQREERPELLSVKAAAAAHEYREQIAAKRAELEKLGARADELGRRVVAVLARYHAEQPPLAEKIAEREAQLQRAQRHKAALEMAIAVLDEIGHEVHGRWAEELNRSTSQYLERIAPTLTDLKFDSRLCFGVWHEGGQTPVRSTEESPILSAGTWDQLYLAVRLGLAEFVAQRGSGGLLLLDDPFAHFDDGRFEKAVRLLAEMAAGRHQVVLFSCQRQRFEWLRWRNPGWFDSHIVARAVREPLQGA